MVFSSLTFLLVFLPIVLILYYISPSIRIRNLVLFIFSMLFYAWGEPVYVVIMIISILNDYYHSIWIDHFQKRGDKETTVVLLISSIIVNLALLSFFKYSDFLIQNINLIFKQDIPLLNLPLPVGISFYTFQTMSYTIDVYRRNVKVQKNILTMSTYVTMFPQLIAGPIVRYETVEAELKRRQISWAKTSEGTRRFVIGLGKKVILANQMAIIADSVFSLDPAKRNMMLAWLGLIAYALQIYFDFSGYSDMAIGMGKMFGFTFLENFNYPYISRSIAEFWRRWHISLSTWFRDYVYIPMGGSRKSLLNWLRNILIVWGLTGLWHGAAWNFVLWGLYFGVVLIIERLLLSRILKKIPLIGHIYSLAIILFGWVLFRSESLSQIMSFTSSLIGRHGLGTFSDLTELNFIYLIPFLFVSLIGATPLPKRISNLLTTKIPLPIRDIALTLIFLFALVFLVNESFNPFIYYRF